MKGVGSARLLLPALLLLGAGLSLYGCRERRRPIALSPDAGPPVEVVQRARTGDPEKARAARWAGALVEEHEPDDDRDHAQPLEAGKGIRGSVAPPTSGGAGKGDDDWYSYLVQTPPAGPTGGTSAQELRVQLSSASDLQLEVLDGDGKRMLLADDQPAGQPETVSGLTMAAGQTLYLRVRQSPRGQRDQREQKAGAVVYTLDPAYVLTVEQTAAAPGSELEPNDSALQATPAAAGDLGGVLLSKKDEDWFVIAVPPAATGGAGHGGIVRVELQTPAVVPSLRVESAVAPASPAPGARPAAAGRTLLTEVKAAPGQEELKLRNLGLPTGASQLYLAVRSQTWKRPGPAGAAAGRYHLRVTLEPALEDAEQEPNETPAQATVLVVSRRGGGEGDGELNGFLWPGDADCYRVPVEGATLVTFQLRLPQGCAAQLVPALPVAQASPPPGAEPGEPNEIERTQSLQVHTSDVAQVRVVNVDRKGCGDAPYQLSAHLKPDPSPAPSP